MKYVPTKDLIPHNKNPRLIKDEAFEKLCDSLMNNPSYFAARPIIYSNRTGKNIIIAGNMRHRAAEFIGLKEVPAVLIACLEEAQEREIMIRDNVSSGEFDWDMLANDWDHDELADWGVNVPNLSIISDDLEEEEAPKKKKKEVCCPNCGFELLSSKK